MTITWYGQSFFEIRVKSAGGSGGELFNIVIDPFDESIGLKPPKVEAGILLVTHNHPDHNNVKTVKGEPFLVNEPGEYEVKGVFIKAIPSFHDNEQGKKLGSNIIYKIETEGIKICHLGNFGQKELDENQLEEISEVDILMLSIAGPFTDARRASEIISQIEPRMVIPMHYKIPGLKADIDGLDKFLKVMGEEKIEPEEKLKITVRDLPKEETKIVVLEP